MPRPKSTPDRVPLEVVLDLLQSSQAITLAAVAERSGLSPATLVQRFGTKAVMISRALAQAWDDLDASTEEAIAAHGRTPANAVDILTALTGQGEDPATEALGLRVLAEDIADPAARARGRAWGNRLLEVLEECLGEPGAARLMLEQWQGIWTWWAFDPQGSLQSHVRARLSATFLAETPSFGPRGERA